MVSLFIVTSIAVYGVENTRRHWCHCSTVIRVVRFGLLTSTVSVIQNTHATKRTLSAMTLQFIQ